MPLPKHLRSSVGERIGSSAETIADLSQAILERLQASEFGCLALIDISRRYAGTSRKLGYPISVLLSKMESEGLLFVKEFESLNKTYIFSEERVLEIAEKIKDTGQDIWANVEKALAPVK